jgi:hypothetical protein
MASERDAVFIIDHEGPLRTALVGLLTGMGVPTRESGSAKELREALIAEDPPRVLLVGDELQDGGGLDTVLETFAVKPAGDAPRSPILCRLTDVRADVELLDLLRRRGFKHFIYRDDPHESSAATLRGIFEGSNAAGASCELGVPGVITIESFALQCVVAGISESGCSIALTKDGMPRVPPIGEVLDVAFDAHDLSILASGRVDSLTGGVGHNADKLFLGLSFDPANEKLHTQVRICMERARSVSAHLQDEIDSRVECITAPIEVSELNSARSALGATGGTERAGDGTRRRRWLWPAIAGGGALVTGLVLAAALLWRSPPEEEGPEDTASIAPAHADATPPPAGAAAAAGKPAPAAPATAPSAPADKTTADKPAPGPEASLNPRILARAHAKYDGTELTHKQLRTALQHAVTAKKWEEAIDAGLALLWQGDIDAQEQTGVAKACQKAGYALAAVAMYEEAAKRSEGGGGDALVSAARILLSLGDSEHAETNLRKVLSLAGNGGKAEAKKLLGSLPHNAASH